MRILLADDQSRVRFALRTLLAMQPELKVVAEAVTVAELLEMAETTLPDLALVDWELPGLAMSAVIPVLKRLSPETWIVVLSGLPEATHAALAAGADGFASKSQPPEMLLDQIFTARSLVAMRNGTMPQQSGPDD